MSLTTVTNLTSPKPNAPAGSPSSSTQWTGPAAAVLEHLSISGSIRLACERAGLPRTHFDEWRATDPDFTAAVSAALHAAAEHLEDVAWARALYGIPGPASVTGAPPARDYDHTLLMFLLKAHLPERYHDRILLETHRKAALAADQDSPTTKSDEPDLSLLSDEELQLLLQLVQKTSRTPTATPAR
jgi:hypothetical protein